MNTNETNNDDSILGGDNPNNGNGQIRNTGDIKGFSRSGDATSRKPGENAGDFHFDRYRFKGDRPTPKPAPESTAVPMEPMQEGPMARQDNENIGLVERPKKKMSKQKKIAIGIVIGVIILALGALAVMWFINMQRENNFSENDVIFDIDAPVEIKSGSQITYVLTARNSTKTDLINTELFVKYPTGFTLTKASSQITDTNQNRWPLGDIPQGQEIRIEMTGTLIGQENTVASMEAQLTYRPKNFNADFTEATSFHTTLLAPSVTVDLEHPKQATPGSLIEYTITYRNTALEIAENAAIRIEFPEQFELRTATPQADDKTRNIWDLGDVTPRNDGTIELSGTLNGNEGETRRIKVSFGILNSEGVFVAQSETIGSTQLVETSIEITQSVNGEKEVIAKPGDTLRYELAYRNTGATGIRGVVIETTFDETNIDPTKTKAENGIVINGGKITWNSASLPALEVLDAGEQGTLKFEVTLNNFITIKNEREQDVVVSATSRLSSGNLPEVLVSNTAQAKVQTMLQIASEGRYYDFQGPQAIGSGPLPPKVGQTTTYRIFVTLSNTTSDVRDGIVEIRLAPGVAWGAGDEVSAGEDLKFDPSANKITWNVGVIPAGTSQIIPALEASFFVNIRPTANQVGQVVQLTNGGTVTGVDTFTGVNLSATAKPITTTLEFDELANGKDKVVP
jgi:hypothetical protein